MYIFYIYVLVFLKLILSAVFIVQDNRETMYRALLLYRTAMSRL